ncbi:MAG: hypothetical protein IPO62_16585 [Saprospiraceae bacterium]|nr:hypothetical protein [Saprospiraceae bacterium]
MAQAILCAGDLILISCGLVQDVLVLSNSCNNLAVTYKDVFDLATAGCDAGPVGCYKVSQWIVMDWCTSLVRWTWPKLLKSVTWKGLLQFFILIPVRVNMDSYICAGRWKFLRLGFWTTVPMNYITPLK